MSVSLSYKNTQRACVGVYQIIISFCKQYFSDNWRANSILSVLVFCVCSILCGLYLVSRAWFLKAGNRPRLLGESIKNRSKLLKLIDQKGILTKGFLYLIDPKGLNQSTRFCKKKLIDQFCLRPIDQVLGRIEPKGLRQDRPQVLGKKSTLARSRSRFKIFDLVYLSKK